MRSPMLAVLAIILLAGCSGAPVPTPIIIYVTPAPAQTASPALAPTQAAAAASVTVSFGPTASPTLSPTPIATPLPTPTPSPKPTPTPKPTLRPAKLSFNHFEFNGNACWTDVVDSAGRQFSGGVMEFSFDAHNTGQVKSEHIWIAVANEGFSVSPPGKYSGGNVGEGYKVVGDRMVVKGPQVLPGKSRTVKVNVFFEEPSKIEWKMSLYLSDLDLHEQVIVLDAVQEWADFSTVNVC